MLHWAAEKDNAELCRYLVSMDADPNSRDSKDRTPSELAAKFGCFAALTTLQELDEGPPSTMNLQVFRSVPGSRASFLGNEAQKLNVSSTASMESLRGEDSEVGSDLAVNVKAIPEAYKKVIDQIDKLGWDRMQ